MRRVSVDPLLRGHRLPRGREGNREGVRYGGNGRSGACGTLDLLLRVCSSREGGGSLDVAQLATESSCLGGGCLSAEEGGGNTLLVGGLLFFQRGGLAGGRGRPLLFGEFLLRSLGGLPLGDCSCFRIGRPAEAKRTGTGGSKDRASL